MLRSREAFVFTFPGRSLGVGYVLLSHELACGQRPCAPTCACPLPGAVLQEKACPCRGRAGSPLASLPHCSTWIGEPNHVRNSNTVLPPSSHSTGGAREVTRQPGTGWERSPRWGYVFSQLQLLLTLTSPTTSFGVTLRERTAQWETFQTFDPWVSAMDFA